MATTVSHETASEARRLSRRYRDALACLEGCGELTLEKYREVWRLSGAAISEEQVRAIWDASALAGSDTLRSSLHATLSEGIAMFERILADADLESTAAVTAPPSAPPSKFAEAPDLRPRSFVSAEAVSAEIVEAHSSLGATPAETAGSRQQQITVQCPTCGKRLRMKLELLGRQVKCPCGHTFVAPEHSPAVMSQSAPSAMRIAPGSVYTSLNGLDSGKYQQYLQRIIQKNDPTERLREIASIVVADVCAGSFEALRAVLQSIGCDDRGEVTVGAAFLVSRLLRPDEQRARKLLLDVYETIGDSTFFGGAPLPRLGYVATLAGDTEALTAMAQARKDANGADRVSALQKALSERNGDECIRNIVWGEALDKVYRSEIIMQALPTSLPGKAAFLASIAEAASPTRGPRNTLQVTHSKGANRAVDAGTSWKVAPLAYVAFFTAVPILFMPFLFPLPLTFGILALRQIRRNPGLLGRGRAIFAIIWGCIGILLSILFIGIVMNSLR